MTTEYKLTN